MSGRPSSIARVDVEFTPTTALITTVRVFVEDFYAKATANPDAAHRLALATHELLENATKYSSNGEAALMIQVNTSTKAVWVRTRNLATPARVAEVKEAFRAIASSTSSRDFYRDAVHRTAVRKTGSGGLGLARIWAEADLRLRLSIRGDRVEIGGRGSLRGA